MLMRRHTIHRRDHALIRWLVFIQLIFLVWIVLVGYVGYGFCDVWHPFVGPQGARPCHLCGAINPRAGRRQNCVCDHRISVYGRAHFGLLARAWQRFSQLVLVFILIRQYGVIWRRGMCQGALSVPSTELCTRN
jgi:hypothetical protein